MQHQIYRFFWNNINNNISKFSKFLKNEKNSGKKVKGWHMLNFHPRKKIKVVPGSLCIKFRKTEQRTEFQHFDNP